MTEARRSTSSKQCACLEGTIQLTDAGVGPKTSHGHVPDGQRIRPAMRSGVTFNYTASCTPRAGRWAAGVCRSRSHWA